jgi:LCP family protein required for cell wall assembly
VEIDVMRIPTWFVLTWVVVISLIAVGASAFAYGFVRDRAAELDSVLELPNPPQVGRSADNANPTATPTVEPPTPVPAESQVTPDDTTPAGVVENNPTPEAPANADPYGTWQDPRRVSVLLMGIDQRAGEVGTFPTDTMILFSVDPVGKTAAILSIPRDLWVEYPGLQSEGRINAANIMGDEITYPGGGGPAFAVKTVEKVLGVRIQYYVLVNFEVFYKLADAIGPIEVCPQQTIDDDKYPDGSYGYITVHFDPGCQELDSERLLQYARVRHNDSDIGRSERQQEVIMSIRKKVLSTGGVTALIPQAADLWQSLQNNIRTNLSFEDMVRLARTAEGIAPDNIRQDQITFADVEISTSPEGDEILVPIDSDIRSKILDLFRPAGVPADGQ